MERHDKVDDDCRALNTRLSRDGRGLLESVFNLKTFHPVLFSFATCAFLAIMLFRSVGSFVLLQYATNALRAQNSTPQALNPQLTNTIGDKGGPTLYYNGSGPVPPFASSAFV